MADPLSISAGVLALVTFGVQTSSSLLELVKEFKRAPTAVRQLIEELHALIGVLQGLDATIRSTDTEFAELEIPLRRCSKACQDFKQIISRLAGQSDEAKANFQSWAKLKWLNSDINGFKESIAGYKSTITVALCNFNLRTSKITLNVFEEYKEMISTTTYDLNNRLQHIDDTLQTLQLRDLDAAEGGTSPVEVQQERDSILKCLEICNYVSRNVEKLHDDAAQNDASTSSSNDSASRVPASALLVANNLTGSGVQLEVHLNQIREFLKRRHDAFNQSTSPTEQEELLKEMDGLQRSIDLCVDAAKVAEQSRTNVIEDVSASDDAYQAIVSTVGQLIFARGVKAGSRSVQLLGQMSDETIQSIMTKGRGMAAEMQQKSEESEEAFERYGVGRNLRPDRTK